MITANENGDRRRQQAVPGRTNVTDKGRNELSTFFGALSPACSPASDGLPIFSLPYAVWFVFVTCPTERMKLAKMKRNGLKRGNMREVQLISAQYLDLAVSAYELSAGDERQRMWAIMWQAGWRWRLANGDGGIIMVLDINLAVSDNGVDILFRPKNDAIKRRVNMLTRVAKNNCA